MSESSSSHSQDGAPLLELPAVIRKNRRRRAVLVVVSALIAVAGFGLHQWFAGRVVSEWAAVQGAEYPLKAASAGKVLQVAVRDGQLVEAGELLLALDPVPLERLWPKRKPLSTWPCVAGSPRRTPTLPCARRRSMPAVFQMRRAGRKKAPGLIWNSGTAEHARCAVCPAQSSCFGGRARGGVPAEADARANMEKARTRLKDSSDSGRRRIRNCGGCMTRRGIPGPAGSGELWRTRVEEARTALQHAVLIAPVRGKVFWVKAAQNGNVARGDELMKISPWKICGVVARFTAGTP